MIKRRSDLLSKDRKSLFGIFDERDDFAIVKDFKSFIHEHLLGVWKTGDQVTLVLGQGRSKGALARTLKKSTVFRKRDPSSPESLVLRMRQQFSLNEFVHWTGKIRSHESRMAG
jgi:hypothetical protein